MKRLPAAPASKAKIITLDIETAPLSVYSWGVWEENVGLDQVQEDFTILAFCAKPLGGKAIYRDTGGRGVKNVRDDKELVHELWSVLDDADIVVTQNGVAFDIKKINARMLAHKMPPYSPVRHVDTKLVAKKHFAFTSNRLAWMSERYTDTPKSSHKKFPGFELWAECLKDNPKAWAEMKRYNVRDVEATERLYLEMRPWISGHPNVAAYADSAINPTCPRCGSKNLQKRGYARSQSGSYNRFQCQECGGWSKSRNILGSATARHGLLAG